MKISLDTNSLPMAQLQRVVHKRHTDYDDAHQSTSDCSTEFPLCTGNIWDAGFLIESDATFVEHDNVDNVRNRNK